MSTSYRVVIHCDEARSTRCLGLLELAGTTLGITDRAATVPLAQGWLRGYGPVDTYDVCPACQTPVTAQVIQLGLPGFDHLTRTGLGEEEGKGEDAERGREQAEAGRGGGDVEGRHSSEDGSNQQQHDVDTGHHELPS